ncbi:hypothetical protein KP509_15G046200 [Ceratopteris richardii]|uniref:Growth-regulating factor n=1 Tax=Ceratopteris richardii TaxID=49495 RepID=A0A8T2T6N5_CERRI|nr:hypothetical protein KP509_15G046200 [Ceratopteris richardii]
MNSATGAADRLASEDRATTANGAKLTRADTFPLRMQLQREAEGRSTSFFRSNSCVTADNCRLAACSAAAAAPVGGHVFEGQHAILAGGGGDGTYAPDSRMLRSEAMMSASQAILQHHHQQQHHDVPLKSAVISYGAAHEMEHKGQLILQQQQQQHVVQPLFTPSQLRELQLHALIFKHMLCGVNVPPELVLLVRTSVAALAGMTTGVAHLGSYWGNYHLGYGASLDPEPGRCRRTDGKKWRCARDVVPDQKYCERHMHRGRHRAARKPLDPLLPPSATSSSASTISTTPSPASSTLSGAPSTLPRSSVGTPSSSPRAIPSSLHLQQQQHQLSLQAASAKDLRTINGDDLFPDSGSGVTSSEVSGLSAISSTMNSPLCNIQSRSFIGGGVYETIGGLSRESEGQPLRHFFDDWPRSGRRDPSPMTWTELENEQRQSQQRTTHAASGTSATQLSISIPNLQSEFTTNGTSPRGGRLALSPLKLSMSRGDEDPMGMEAAATQMGLGVGGLVGGAEERQRHGSSNSSNSWVPIAWETAGVGGPLGEVLQSGSSTPRGANGSHAAAVVNGGGLNLMTDAWESSPRTTPAASSPTGVLQINSAFGCFSSDNSTASSPRSAAVLKPLPESTM